MYFPPFEDKIKLKLKLKIELTTKNLALRFEINNAGANRVPLGVNTRFKQI